MTYDPEIHHRRSTRLKVYDYATANAYFVTVCIHRREALLAETDDGVALLTLAGHCVHEEWGRLPNYFPGVGLDVFIVMPNHLHGIVVLGSEPDALAERSRRGEALPSLGQVMRAFKARSAIVANRSLGREGA